MHANLLRLWAVLLLTSWSARGAWALDLAAAEKAARAYLACHDPVLRRSLEAQLAKYDADYEAVLKSLGTREFAAVRPGYHPEEHFSLPELREAHAEDLLYFTVPKTYRPDRPSGLIVFMHGGGNETSRRAPRVFMRIPEQGEPLGSYLLGDVFAATGMIAVGPSAPWDESTSRRWCVRESDQYLADVICECKSRFNIDADRVFLMGHSMGGFGAYHHIQRQPDRFAAVIACAGSWSLAYWPVIRGTPLCIIHGVHDAQPGGRPHYTDVEYARWTDRILGREELEHTYLERPGGHAVTGGRKEIAAFFASARALRRDPYYPHVAVASPVGFRDGYYCWPVMHNRWLSLNESAQGDLLYDELESHGGDDDFRHWRLEHTRVKHSGAAVEAINRGDNRIVVTTQNAARFTVWLHPRMIELARPVTIVVDGKLAFAGMLRASLAIALESYGRRGDWGLIYPIKVELVKDKGEFRGSQP